MSAMSDAGPVSWPPYIVLELNGRIQPGSRQRMHVENTLLAQESLRPNSQGVAMSSISAPFHFFFISPIQTLMALELSCAARNTIFHN